MPSQVESIFCFMEKIIVAKKIPDFDKPKDWRDLMANDKTWRWTGCSKRRWIENWKGLTPTQRALMVSLWLYGGNKSFCWASMRRLAGELNLARNTIQRNIKILEKKQFIKIEKKKGLKGNYHLYFLLK